MTGDMASHMRPFRPFRPFRLFSRRASVGRLGLCYRGHKHQRTCFSHAGDGRRRSPNRRLAFLRSTDFDAAWLSGLIGAAHEDAGVTRPRHSPKPIDTKLSRRHRARNTISSPSRRNVRCSPFGSRSGSLPPRTISSSDPQLVWSGPDNVPVPMRSPGRRLQPPLVW